MNQTRFFSCALIAGALATATFAASAQSGVTPALTDAEASAQVATAEDVDAGDDANTRPEIDRLCLKHTGSRIAARDSPGRRCSAFGRVYTQDDLQRTGAINLTDALRMLDPAIR